MSKNNHIDDLHELIQSLTKEEKRYLNLFAKTMGGSSSKYMRVFALIEEQPQYDESALKLRMQRLQLPISQLSAYKQQIFRLIYRALQALHQESSVEEEILSHLRTLTILYRKRLFSQALALLHKAHKLAQDYDKLYYLPRLSAWYALLYQGSAFSGVGEAELEATLAQEQQDWERLGVLVRYRAWVLRSDFRRKVFYARDAQVLEWMEAQKLPALPQAGLSVQLAQWHGMAMYYIFRREPQEALRVFDAIVQRLNVGKYLEDGDLLRLYVAAILGAFVCILHIEPLESEAFEGYARLLESIELRRLAADQRLMLIQQQQNFHLLRQDYAAVLPLGKQLEDLLSQLPTSSLRAWDILLIRLTAARAAMGLGDWAQAQCLLDEICKQRRRGVELLHNTARLMRLLVLAEREEWLMLPYSVRQLHRNLQRRGQLYPIESLLLRGVNRLADANDESSRRKTWRRFAQKLKPLAEGGDGVQREILLYFDFYAYIKGKCSH